MSEIKNNPIYDKLTPQRKKLVDEVLANLEKGVGLWKRGWVGSAPVSAITGKRYNGTNRFYLTNAMLARGYEDNRWLTYKQMQEKGWEFKKDENGESRGKGAGVPIEFYELRDKQTKQPFDRHTLDGMTADEKADYMDENVYPLRKYYCVFNGDLIEGIPQREQVERDPSGYSERAEKIIQTWSDTEAKIIYGGDIACYIPSKDEIHVPHKSAFINLPEYYMTTLHEAGHSTGKKGRLDRDLSATFGTPDYAEEELRAEIASMFIAQDLEIEMTESHIQNNSAYLQSWKAKIEDNPNVLFTAIADAEKIARFVMAKEAVKEAEPFAVEEEADEYGESVYKVKMTSPHGQTSYALPNSFKSREELMAAFNEMQKLPQWQDKEFYEVSLDELQELSVQKAEKEEARIADMANDKECEYIAVGLDSDENGDDVYKIYRVAEMGCVKQVGHYAFDEKPTPETVTELLQRMPEYEGKTLREVPIKDLQDISTYRYEKELEAEKAKAEKMERLAQVEEEKSDVFLPPSEVAAQAAEAAAAVAAVDMTSRGVESLTNMDDRDVVDRASKTKQGEKFMALFNGETVLEGATSEETEKKNERSLMARIAMQSGDIDQTLRIFKASGQFREDKPAEYYEQMVREEMKFVNDLRAAHTPPVPETSGRSRFTNAKT